MKDKHLHNSTDSALLKAIHKQVNQNLVIDHRLFVQKIAVKFVIYTTLVVSSYYMLYELTSPIAFCCAFVGYGFFSLLFAFNFSHDFSHNTVFKRKWLNNICFSLIYTIVGAHAEAWKSRHVNSHHFAPNVADYDSDLKISKIIRVIPGSPYLWFHKYQHWYAPFAYTTYSLFWVFVKDFVILFSADPYQRHKSFMYHLWFWVQKSAYIFIAIIMPICFSQQTWSTIALGFLMMHLLQSLFLLFTFFMTHHIVGLTYPKTDANGYINVSWLMNQVKSSNDMHPFSKTANFIFGGFNNHVAHHLFPHHHHIYYPQMSKIIYSVLRESGTQPSQTTYWGGIVAHLKHLKNLSKDDSPVQEKA